jgi:F-type H+-transporting ATPase subunit c
MLLGLSILQTPVILGLIAAIIIKNHQVVADVDGYRMIAAGMALALGAIGPTIGLSFFSQRICSLLGTEPYSYNRLITFIFTSLALIETPLLLVFITNMLIVRGSSSDIHDTVRYFCASIAIGLSTLGAGLSSARTAASAARAIAQQPDTALLVSRSSLLSQTLIDTSPIYGLIIALLLLLIH